MKRGQGGLVWVVAVVLTLLYAAAVAGTAERRGQPPLPWFVTGLFTPVVSFLVLLLFFPRPGTPVDELTADDAVAASAVARSLAAEPGLSVHALVARTGLREREVLDQLRALQNLGRATRDDAGRYDLTPG
ncbi:MAG: hypothetical protein WEB03_10515 [Nitriliruptor sp.]|uniref:hypothetical protein n=1 Tax=Nitriliruptor sp. TaxID=2448056 RepID=UPI00349FF5B0